MNPGPFGLASAEIGDLARSTVAVLDLVAALWAGRKNRDEDPGIGTLEIRALPAITLWHGRWLPAPLRIGNDAIRHDARASVDCL